MGGPEDGYFPLLYVVKMSYIGGWVVQKSLKTPLHNIKMAPNAVTENNTMKISRVKSKICKIVSIYQKCDCQFCPLFFFSFSFLGNLKR